MVTLNEEMTIASDADAIWPLLRDPAVVAGCIPGAQLSADSDDEVWRGSIRVKFGPTVALFRGEATLEFNDEARRVTLDGRGIDGRGASRALANAVIELRAADAGHTTMKVEGEFTVTGPLETFVNAGGVHVARALLSEFCSNIAAAVAQASDAQGSATGDGDGAAAAGDDAAAGAAHTGAQQAGHGTPSGDAAAPGSPSAAAPSARAAQAGEQARQTAPPQATELSASSLLWRALLGWIKNLFGKGN